MSALKYSAVRRVMASKLGSGAESRIPVAARAVNRASSPCQSILPICSSACGMLTPGPRCAAGNFFAVLRQPACSLRPPCPYRLRQPARAPRALSGTGTLRAHSGHALCFRTLLIGKTPRSMRLRADMSCLSARALSAVVEKLLLRASLSRFRPQKGQLAGSVLDLLIHAHPRGMPAGYAVVQQHRPPAG